MTRYWSLKINCEESEGDLLDNILGVNSNMGHVTWGLEIIEGEDDIGLDYIAYFLDLLEGNYEKLSLIGVERSDISIWLLYEYDQQCNMEFSPDNMKRMGDNGVVLCVSCWQK